MQNLPSGSTFVGSLKLTYISKVNLRLTLHLALLRPLCTMQCHRRQRAHLERRDRERERDTLISGSDLLLEFGVTQKQTE